MRVLILDITHSGDILCEELISRGESVTCVDVYHVESKERKDALRDIGVTVCDDVPVGYYDLLISPAHCPDSFFDNVTYGRKETFSQAVKELIDDDRYRIEITGVKGKTSTAYLLAGLLYESGCSVFLHTSRGQGPWTDKGHEIVRNMSIAPPSLLRLPEENYDCIIAEVSLGGSGKADIALITNLTEDYGIARNTRKASEAKADILTDGVNIVREDELAIWKRFGDRRFQTYGGNVEIVSEPGLGKPMTIGFDYCSEHFVVDLSDDFLALQYIPAIEAALKVCESMSVPSRYVISGLKRFNGVPGRGRISKEDGVWHVRDRNPGVSHISMGMTFECLRKMGGLDEAVAVVDPVSKKVCDKMDVDLMRKVASEYGVPILFTDGCGSKPDIPKGTHVVIEFVKEGYQ